jgi:putative Holliday junction resolvase
MKTLAVDFGTKRVGIAWGEDGRTYSSQTMPVTGEEDAARKLLDLVAKERPDVLVAGLPVRLDGSEQAEARHIRSFFLSISRSLSLPVVFVDERLTTVEARAILREQGLSERNMRQRLDAEVARLLLEQYYRDRRVQ